MIHIYIFTACWVESETFPASHPGIDLIGVFILFSVCISSTRLLFRSKLQSECKPWGIVLCCKML